MEEQARAYPSYDTLRPYDVLNTLQQKARYMAWMILKKCQEFHKISNSKYDMRIITAESLTAGLISSTLVDVPLFGLYKFGGFAVYDTAAKEKYLNVTVREDAKHSPPRDGYDPEMAVYTHACASQMAIGALVNSYTPEAYPTIAIAVTGNAMPTPNNEEYLGSVHIGIATYVDDTTKALKVDDVSKQTPIYVKTIYVDMTNEFEQLATEWKTTPPDKRTLKAYVTKNQILDTDVPARFHQHDFNSPHLTSLSANMTRLATVVRALEEGISVITSPLMPGNERFTHLERTIYCEDAKVVRNTEYKLDKQV